MGVVGVIAEYNPFHNGHAYHLKEAKGGANDAVVVVMSPNVTQRGDFPLFDKRIRTLAALKNGADLVLELPSVYAVATAEKFALGAVSVLEALGFVDTLSFGSESGDLNSLCTAAYLVNDENVIRKTKEYLNRGESFAKARYLAVSEASETAAQMILNPNDILATEYIKALTGLNSEIKPVPVKRYKSGHDSLATGKFASAKYIRENLWQTAEFVPDSAYEIYRKAFTGGNFSKGIKSVSDAVIAILRLMPAEKIKSLADVGEGLENRIKRAACECADLDELCESIKTKRYSMARIRRILMYALLGISADDQKIKLPYVRILGMNDTGANLLHMKSGETPLVSSLAQAKKISPDAMRFAQIEQNCTDIFSLTLKNKKCGKNEFSAPIIRI